MPLSFSIAEPSGDDVTLSATVNGNPVTLTNQTVFTDGPNIDTVINFYAIEANQVEDGTNLLLVLTAQSPAGTVSDSLFLILIAHHHPLNLMQQILHFMVLATSMPNK